MFSFDSIAPYHQLRLDRLSSSQVKCDPLNSHDNMHDTRQFYSLFFSNITIHNQTDMTSQFSQKTKHCFSSALCIIIPKLTYEQHIEAGSTALELQQLSYRVNWNNICTCQRLILPHPQYCYDNVWLIPGFQPVAERQSTYFIFGKPAWRAQIRQLVSHRNNCLSLLCEIHARSGDLTPNSL